MPSAHAAAATTTVSRHCSPSSCGASERTPWAKASSMASVSPGGGAYTHQQVANGSAA